MFVCAYIVFLFVCLYAFVVVSFCVGVILYLCRFVPVMYRLILVTPALGNVYFRNGFILYANASHFIITITVNYVVILVTHLLSYE